MNGVATHMLRALPMPRVRDPNMTPKTSRAIAWVVRLRGVLASASESVTTAENVTA